MKKQIKKLLNLLLVLLLAAGLFWSGFLMEGQVNQTAVAQRENNVVIYSLSGSDVSIVRNGENLKLGKNANLNQGDLINSDQGQQVEIRFAGNGVIRMDQNSSVLISEENFQNKQYLFRIMNGRVWLNNLYSNANVNVLLDDGVVIPDQSVSYYDAENGTTLIYANTNNLEVGFVDQNFTTSEPLDITQEKTFLNALLVPQGTQITLYKNKIDGEETTIKKLLYSKLIKEFQYSVFDVNLLSTDSWLKQNVQADSDLAVDIKNNRLDSISSLGRKLQSVDGFRYQLGNLWDSFTSVLTFSKEKVAQRELANALAYLDDSEYLYSVGRNDEAKARFDIYQTKINEVINNYGVLFKKQADQELTNRLQYLSFVSPSDNLYQLKTQLLAAYENSLKGSAQEVTQSFQSLTDKLNVLNFYASNKDFKLVQSVFNDYFTQINAVVAANKDSLMADPTLLRRQVQLLDNLFIQYSEFYRVDFFKALLLVENQYLDLLKVGPDKYEEMETFISERIDFLRKLQTFFLNGEVPLNDAKNIVALLITEIDKLQLPADLQVGVTQLFNERLADFAVFNRFLNSAEYVSSAFKGKTYSDRFAAFKKDLTETVSVQELHTTAVSGAASTTVQGAGTTTNSTTSGNVTQPKVPRVKP